MINIDLLINNEEIVGFEISGHANFDEYGSDIVCAAVSILAYTCINTLDKNEKNIEFLDNEDKMYLYYKDDDIKTKVIYDYFLTGIDSLEKSYEDYVKLNYKEV